MSIGEKVEAIRKIHPSWSFEQSWRHAETVHPELFTGSAAQNQSTAEDTAELERINVISRRLMDRNPRLTCGEARRIVRLCKPPKVAAAAPKVMLVQAVECDMATKIEAGLQD